ncbi:MAG: hypothetical protein HKP01_07045, partial [Gemmatimonadetes bacterium]|nr:hypothetical protein [Gemmatimonadota bacterium]
MMKCAAPVRACFSLLLLLLPGPLLAQQEPGNDVTDDGLQNEWFPGEFVVAPLLAAPLEVR